MTTPEGKVKKAVKGLLDPLKPRVWYDMPVPGGYGKSTLDFIGVAYGHPFAVEAKALGGKVTERQWTTIRALQTAGVQCCIVDPRPESLHLLDLWLKAARLHDRTREITPVDPATVTMIDEVIDTVVVTDIRNYSTER